MCFARQVFCPKFQVKFPYSCGCISPQPRFSIQWGGIVPLTSLQIALPSQVVQEIVGRSGGSSGTVAQRNPANHVGCKTPCKSWDKLHLHINWCRISEPSTVVVVVAVHHPAVFSVTPCCILCPERLPQAEQNTAAPLRNPGRPNGWTCLPQQQGLWS